VTYEQLIEIAGDESRAAYLAKHFPYERMTVDEWYAVTLHVMSKIEERTQHRGRRKAA
jgi:hypothetical protein